MTLTDRPQTNWYNNGSIVMDGARAEWLVNNGEPGVRILSEGLRWPGAI